MPGKRRVTWKGLSMAREEQQDALENLVEVVVKPVLTKVSVFLHPLVALFQL